MRFNVKLEMAENVKEFCTITNRYSWEQELHSGRHIVDAKSILGIFSLDLSKPIDYVCDQDDVNLRDELKRFIAK